MIIVPVSFSVDGSKLLIHLKTLLEHPDNMLAIHPRYDILELISCLIFICDIIKSIYSSRQIDLTTIWLEK
jgi:hypothetical protein